MRDDLNELLSAKIIEILEKLAFVFAEPVEAADDGFDGETISMEAAFTGPFSGSVGLEFEAGVVAELAANMLGLEDPEDLTPEQRTDALKEALNIICGNILPVIAGKTAVFHIAAPAFPGVGPAARADAAKAVVSLRMDEGRCVVYLFVNGEPHGASGGGAT